jgi:hypothetical protein
VGGKVAKSKSAQLICSRSLRLGGRRSSFGVARRVRAQSGPGMGDELHNGCVQGSTTSTHNLKERQ